MKVWYGRCRQLLSAQDFRHQDSEKGGSRQIGIQHCWSPVWSCRFYPRKASQELQGRGCSIRWKNRTRIEHGQTVKGQFVIFYISHIVKGFSWFLCIIKVFVILFWKYTYIKFIEYWVLFWILNLATHKKILTLKLVSSTSYFYKQNLRACESQ